MDDLDTYPLVTVTGLEESRDFFVKFFGMSLVFEASWVVMLARTEGGPIVLGLMTADHPSNPPGPEIFAGRGMILTLQVEDASKAFADVQKLGASVTYGLKAEPRGQRRFMVRDPSGLLVDVVEQIDPAPGFWEKYMRA